MIRLFSVESDLSTSALYTTNNLTLGAEGLMNYYWNEKKIVLQDLDTHGLFLKYVLGAIWKNRPNDTNSMWTTSSRYDIALY